MDIKKLTDYELQDVAARYGLEYAAVRAVVMVESSGHGFDPNTGKIIIQFEPAWYRRLDLKDGINGGDGIWSSNKVELQPKEWLAFNDAFKRDPDAAMQATSWGMMQVMGFHYRDLDFTSVGAMVDFCKVSEANQVDIGVKLIKKSARLLDAIKTHDWPTFAYYYNGPNYKVNNYDRRLAAEHNKALA